MLLDIELDHEKFEELVAGTCLEELSFEELVNIAINSEEINPGKNKLWEFVGAYYRYNLNNLPIIVIDRAQTVGGYSNSELSINVVDDNTLKCNDCKFESLIYAKLAEKENNVKL